jgi:serine/threonine protein kinase
MTKYQLLEGKLNIKEKIGSGTSAIAYKAILKTPRKKLHCIVKKLRKDDNEINSKFCWKKAGFMKEYKPYKNIDIEYLNQSNSPLHDGECLVKVKNATGPWSKDHAKKILYGTNYSTEYAIAKLLDKKVSPSLPSKIFCKSITAFSTTSHLNIVMDNAGFELEKYLHELTLDQLKSIVKQVLVALQWAQHLVKFKHHDLHCGNVYFKFKQVPSKWILPCGSFVTLECTDVQAVIADFGLSAATRKETRLSRIDYDQLSVSKKEWGKWKCDLEGNEGYDFIVLMDSLKDECHGSKLQWVKFIISEFRKLQPNLRLSKIGRPLCNVSVAPSKILQKLFI